MLFCCIKAEFKSGSLSRNRRLTSLWHDQDHQNHRGERSEHRPIPGTVFDLETLGGENRLETVGVDRAGPDIIDAGIRRFGQGDFRLSTLSSTTGFRKLSSRAIWQRTSFLSLISPSMWRFFPSSAGLSRTGVEGEGQA